MRSRNRQGGNAALAVVVLLALALLVVGPVTLHFGQKRHNQLTFDIAARYPTDKPVVNGEIFASTLRAIIEHELQGRTGWRPNDFFLWGPGLWADNNSNRQLGIAQALRKTVSIFKDHLTKVSSNEYDANLVVAEAALHNDMEKFWFPAAETKLKEAASALQRYIDGLKSTPPRSRPITARNIELIRLFQAWTDLLGDAHANLFKEREADGKQVASWHTDDYFYHAQGFAHVMYHATLALKREYALDLLNRPSLVTLMDEVASALGRAAVLKPLIILNGGSSSIFANHRRNLDVYMVEARQKMYSIREELEK